MSKFVIQGKAVVDRQVKENQMMICENGKIAFIGEKANLPRDLSDLVPDLIVEEGCIVPGFIDIHIHGSQGYDVMDATRESLEGIAKALVSYGVTGFLATTLTADLSLLLQVLQISKELTSQSFPGAELLGVHLEGPWINKQYKGAQNELHVMSPSLEDAKQLVEAGGELLKVVTLAPEGPNAKETIEYLSNHGVKVSVGHSDSTYQTVADSIPYGLTHVTHCFNAMRSLHHREPGVVGAALYHDELTTELIADGIHVHPVVMSILQRIKPADRLILVSDGMRAVGMKDGQYDLGGLRVQVVNGEARLEDGTLAGSTLTMDRAVRNMIQLCQVPLADAVAMASEVPARAIGCGDRKGQLKVGYDADFVVLEEDLSVKGTFCDGRLVYSKEH